MKKIISLLLTAIMVFSLVPALFVRDGLAADDKYVKNSTSAAINVYKEANDASKVVATLPVSGVAKYVSSNGAFLKIENPAGYVKTSQVLLQTMKRVSCCTRRGSGHIAECFVQTRKISPVNSIVHSIHNIASDTDNIFVIHNIPPAFRDRFRRRPLRLY